MTILRRTRWAAFFGLTLLASAGCSSTLRHAEPPPDSYTMTSVSLERNESKKQISAARVGRTFFQAADMPLRGRVLISADHDGAIAVAVLSEQLWRDSFAGEVIGRAIKVNGESLTVVGVMPKSFDSPPGTAMWLPRKDSIGK
jgi:hypothetical protein